MLIRVILFLLCMSFGAGMAVAQLQATNLVRPVNKLRDYNGTYDGAPGTGSIGYSTLYRDNEDNGATSNCRGEGCGKHPGVDIPVPSGTSVYSVTGGTVVMSECNDSWGGLIVIRATNPWNFGEQIYFTYAHLKTRRYTFGTLVNVGDYVSAGTRIGASGGGNNDACAGRSTGAHLHFQIDKDDGNPYPWFPALNMLNSKDDNFEVTAKTYNPIVFLTGGYHWSFGGSGNRELWDLFNFQSYGVEDGALWTDSGSDPYIRRGGLTNCGMAKKCSSDISAEASEYWNVSLDLYNKCQSGAGKIYFKTKAEPYWDEYKSVAFYPWMGSYATKIHMYVNSKWKGIITGLRIDPAENCNPYFWDPTFYGDITLER